MGETEPHKPKKARENEAGFSRKLGAAGVTAGQMALIGRKQKLYKETSSQPLWGVRKILINPTDHDDLNRFPNNAIRTHRYTILTFLPKNLWEQFQRLANAWFLFVSILQLLPNSSINPVQPWSSILPLTIVLLISGVKDAFEDYRRYRMDYRINSRLCNRIDGSEPQLRTITWRSLRVGNIVRLSDEEEVPTDIVVLSTSHPDGVCYVESSTLDGSTDLKIKQAVKETRGDGTMVGMCGIKGRIVCEKPSLSTDSFTGSLKLDAHPRATSLDISNFITKGCNLKNTEWLYGVVVYTGGDTRLLRNSGSPPAKKSRIEHDINIFLVLVFFVMFLAVLVSILCRTYRWQDTNVENLLDNFNVQGTALSVLRFIILYNNLVPISLMVTIDLVRMVQGIFIEGDRQLMSEEDGEHFWAQARSVNLNENLGQVDFVFTDKTGTITENDMTFSMCCIGYRVYGNKNVRRSTAPSTEDLKEPEDFDQSHFLFGQPDDISSSESDVNLEAVRCADRLGCPDSPHSSGDQLSQSNGSLHSYSGEKEMGEGSDSGSLQKFVSGNEIIISEGHNNTSEENDPSKDMELEDMGNQGFRDSPSLGAPDLRTWDSFSMSKVRPRRIDSTPESSGVRPLRCIDELDSVGKYTPERNYWVKSISTFVPRNQQEEEEVSSSESEAPVAPPKSQRLRSSWPPDNSIPGCFREVDKKLRNRSDFNDRKVFKDLNHGGERGRTIDLFIKGMALCNTVQPCVETQWSKGHAEPISKMASWVGETGLSVLWNRSATTANNKNVSDISYGTDGDMNASIMPTKRNARPGVNKESTRPFVSQAPSEMCRKTGLKRNLGVTFRDEENEKHTNSVKLQDMRYQAASPDEECLVSAAANLAYSLVERTGDMIGLEIAGSIHRWELLGVNSYTHARSRMSVVLRPIDPHGEKLHGSLLFCKGGDSVMLDLLDLKPGSAAMEKIKKRLKQFAILGLRTLVLGCRFLTEEETETYLRLYTDASTSIFCRDERMTKIADDFENRLEYLGISGVRDKLQQGVAETIEVLMESGIRVWMVTGDCVEYTLHVCHSARILNPRTKVFHATLYNTDRKAKKEGLALYESFRKLRVDRGQGELLCLVVTGRDLQTLLSFSDLQTYFINMACCCDVVVACRVTPSQKAQLVHLVQVRLSPQPIALAVGDGGNDVAMLQKSHVGVCIMKNEGMQSFGSADFGIAQFRFLRRLLFVHGRLNYMRISTVVLWSFFKNFCLVLPIFFYQPNAYWSGISIYDSSVYLSYNLIFTSVPILFYGFMEEDVPNNVLQHVPVLYTLGRRRLYFNVFLFLIWIFEAVISSMLISVLATQVYIMCPVTADGKALGLLGFGTVSLLYSSILSNVRLMLETKLWTPSFVVSMFGISLILPMPVLLMYSKTGWPGVDFVGTASHVLRWLPFWVSLPILVTMEIFIFTCCRYFRTRWFPNMAVFVSIWLDERRTKGTSKEYKPFWSRMRLKCRRVLFLLGGCYSMSTEEMGCGPFWDNELEADIREIFNPLKHRDICDNLPSRRRFRINEKFVTLHSATQNTDALRSNTSFKPRPNAESGAPVEVLSQNAEPMPDGISSDGQSTYASSDGLSALAAKNCKGASKMVKVSHLINRFTLKFMDKQLECDFFIHQRNNFVRRFLVWYRAMFIILAIYYTAQFCVDYKIPLSSDLHNGLDASVVAPTILLVFSLLCAFFITFKNSLFLDNFNLLINCIVLIMCVSYSATYIPGRVDGVLTAVLFPVFTFVILRVAFLQAVFWNIMFLTAYILTYVFIAQEPNSLFRYQNLFHYLPWFLGVDVFVGFVGYRLEYNQRKSFLLDYSVEASRRKQREILNTMLPSFVVDQMINSEVNEEGIPTSLKAEDRGTVSVIFCDVYEFQQVVASIEPTRLVEVLDSLFLCFDKCADQFGCTKIETVFETYLAAAGLNPELEAEGIETAGPQIDALEAVDLALSMLEVASHIRYEATRDGESEVENRKNKNGSVGDASSLLHSHPRRIHVKIGIHSGRVISGVVGAKKPQYALFGDTVNTASRMKTTGEPDFIHISDSSYQLIKHDNSLLFEHRTVEVKGKGQMDTYLLLKVEGSDYPFCNSILCELEMSDLAEIDKIASMHKNEKTKKNRKKTVPDSEIPPSSNLSHHSSLKNSESFAMLDIEQHPKKSPQFNTHANHASPFNPFFSKKTNATLEDKNNEHSSDTLSNIQYPDQMVMDRLQSVGEWLMLKLLLKFRDRAREMRYRDHFYSNKSNTNTIEQALIIFLVTFVVQTLISVFVPSLYVQKDEVIRLDVKYSLMWGVRAVYTGGVFFLWLLFHYRNRPEISGVIEVRWMIFLLNLIFISGACVFALSTAWGVEHVAVPNDGSGEYKLSGDSTIWLFCDTIELFFYIVILHHNTGLLFLNCIWVDLLLLCVSISFIVTTATPTSVTRLTIAAIPFYFLFNLMSAYCKEHIDRITFYINENARQTESRATQLLNDMLPKQVLVEFEEDRLKLAYQHNQISFLFADICGFTSWAKGVDATEVVSTLQRLFAKFDRDSTKFGLYKLCTIGDAYVAVSEPVTETFQDSDVALQGTERVLAMAQSMFRNIAEVRERLGIPGLNMRIGLHYGSCVGGVIGSGRLRYDLWGMDVLTGNMMESNGQPGEICVSEDLRQHLIANIPQRFTFTFNKAVWVIKKFVDSYIIKEARRGRALEEGEHSPARP